MAVLMVSPANAQPATEAGRELVSCDASLLAMSNHVVRYEHALAAFDVLASETPDLVERVIVLMRTVRLCHEASVYYLSLAGAVSEDSPELDPRIDDALRSAALYRDRLIELDQVHRDEMGDGLSANDYGEYLAYVGRAYVLGGATIEGIGLLQEALPRVNEQQAIATSLWLFVGLRELGERDQACALIETIPHSNADCEQSFGSSLRLCGE